AAEPSNTEYRLHLLRAKQEASIVFAKRGDTLAEQKDYASAYAAYHQAFTSDQTNELAQAKMGRRLELQKAQSGELANYDPRSGNIVATSADIKPPQRMRSRDVVQSFIYRDTSLRLVIEQIAEALDLNVLFDESF